jgi:hypothetical protein
MTPIREDGLRYGAIAAGALLLGGAATAGADKLISGGDIADGTVQKRDLAPRAGSGGESLLVSDLNMAAGTTSFIAPGTDYAFPIEEAVAMRPPGGFTARGLAVTTNEGKGSLGIEDVTVKLRVDGQNTSLKCTTSANGFCKDTDSANFDSSDPVALQVKNDNAKFAARTVISLSVEEN